MAGTLLMTGASRGIGRIAAQCVLREHPGIHLIVTVRGSDGAQLTAELTAATGNSNVSAVRCDLASLESIRGTAADLTGRLAAGDLLPLVGFVGNGGIQLTDRTRTSEDGFERTFAVNVLSNHLMVRLLWDYLSTASRIVLVGSDTHFGTLRHNLGVVPAPRWEDAAGLAAPRHDKRALTTAEGRTAYSTSKLGLIYLVHALSRRLPDGIDVYTFNPGYVPNTGLVRDAGLAVRLLSRTAFRGLTATPLASSPETAGKLLARAALGPRPGATGAYIDRATVGCSAPESYDRAREEDLWRTLSQLCGVPAEVP